jgi:insulysin
VYEDAKIVETLTKSDMVEFYKAFISPRSPTRAKLSVHLLAQTAPSIVSETNPPEKQVEQVQTFITQFLNSNGISVENEALNKRLTEVGVSKGEDGIVAAVEAYLKEDAKVPLEKLETIMGEGKKAMDQAMAALGISNSGENGTATKTKQVDGENKAVTKSPTEIKDVPQWKASLATTTGAKPVKELSSFEELEPKL